MAFTVQVLDDAGTVVKSAVVDLTKVIPGYIEQVKEEFQRVLASPITGPHTQPITDADIALLIAAPNYCPFDCDGCHA